MLCVAPVWLAVSDLAAAFCIAALLSLTHGAADGTRSHGGRSLTSREAGEETFQLAEPTVQARGGGAREDTSAGR